MKIRPDTIFPTPEEDAQINAAIASHAVTAPSADLSPAIVA